MRNFFSILLFLIIPILSYAQGESSFGIKIGGYVKNDIIFDSRQTISLRQGHFLLFPKGPQYDVNGKDINAKASFHILAIQTRLKGVITAPDALGAKISGYFEAEFFGNSDLNINTFRLRHAFVKLTWPKTELMLGQWWHPMFITDCYPLTESFNTGAPFQPFSRNPQIRLTQTLGNLKVSASAISQIDFVSNGPDGASSVYLRNSVIPELNLTLQYGNSGDTKNLLYLFGAGGNYKKLTPRLVTEKNYQADETVDNFAGMAFLRIKLPKVTFKFEGVYGQEFYSMTMLGGYAVSSITDTLTYGWNYTPIDVLSFWSDIHSNGEKWQFGIFGGYSRNLGSKEAIERIARADDLTQSSLKQIFYSRGSDIDYVYRIAPRVLFSPGKFRFSAEVEYTAAAYGKPDSKGVVQNTEIVGNLRLLLGAYIFF
jgi:hypothetical protein